MISFDAAPSDWYPFVMQQKVALGELQHAQSPMALSDEKARKFVYQLRYQSMIARLNVLNQVCIPKLSPDLKPKITALINIRILDLLDGLRQRIIHEKPFAQTTTEIQEELFFVLVTGIAALLTVGNAYELLAKDKFKARSIIFKMLGEMKDDMPELNGFIDSLTKAFESVNRLTELIKKLKAETRPQMENGGEENPPPQEATTTK